MDVALKIMESFEKHGLNQFSLQESKDGQMNLMLNEGLLITSIGDEDTNSSTSDARSVARRRHIQSVKQDNISMLKKCPRRGSDRKQFSPQHAWPTGSHQH